MRFVLSNQVLIPQIHPGQFRHHNHELTWIQKHKHVERSFLKVNIQLCFLILGQDFLNIPPVLMCLLCLLVLSFKYLFINSLHKFLGYIPISAPRHCELNPPRQWIVLPVMLTTQPFENSSCLICQNYQINLHKSETRVPYQSSCSFPQIYHELGLSIDMPWLYHWLYHLPSGYLTQPWNMAHRNR